MKNIVQSISCYVSKSCLHTNHSKNYLNENFRNSPLPLHLKTELSACRVQTMVDPELCSSSQPSPRLSKICNITWFH